MGIFDVTDYWKSMLLFTVPFENVKYTIRKTAIRKQEKVELYSVKEWIEILLHFYFENGMKLTVLICSQLFVHG